MSTINGMELPLRVIRNSENLGFATACNRGGRQSDADYILFLNPDTRLFEKSLDRPIRFMEMKGNDRIGICGIQLIDDETRISLTCARFPTPIQFFNKMTGLDRLAPKRFTGHFMTDWNHNEDRIVDQVIGAFYLVHGPLFEKLGGFDERFFVYFEDLDFAFRAYEAGWTSYYLASAQAFHKSGGISQQIRARRMFYYLRSRILYGFKHFGPWEARGLMLGTLVIEPLIRLAGAAGQLSWNATREVLKAYFLLYSDAPRFLRAAHKRMA